MEILLLTKHGDGLGLAYRLAQEGHEISVFSPALDLNDHTGKFKIVQSPYTALKSVKFAIADSPEWGNLKSKLAIYNRPIIGLSDTIELLCDNAVRQYELFDRFGIPTPETKIFTDVGDMFEGGITWEANRTVIRYNNTEFHCDYRDWIPWGMTKIPIGEKVLFQKNSSGMEFLVSGWFNGLKWIDVFSISPYLSGKIYKFAVSYPISSSHIFVTAILSKLDRFLKTLDYHGPISVRVSVHGAKLECTHIYPGFIYPLTYTYLEFIENELGEFLHNIAFSLDFKPTKTKDFVGAVQAQCTEEAFVGAPILGVNDERLKHLVFHSVACTDGEYRLAKGNCIFTATAHGPSLFETSERVYGTVSNIKFPEKNFTSNLNSIANPYFAKLKEWKYI